jgi:hypothetical protein
MQKYAKILSATGSGESTGHEMMSQSLIKK